jgi:transposase
MQEYVGIDLHRRRSVIVRMTRDGEVIDTVRIPNDPVELSLAVEAAGPNPEVVLEATYGWYWAVDVLEDLGAHVHLAHPLGVKAFSYQRVKKDKSDARQLADLLRMQRLPEAWIAPPATRELREIVRYRAKLVALRSNLKAQVHGVLAKEGIGVPMTDLFGVAGTQLLDTLALAPAYATKIRSCRRLMALLEREIEARQREAVRLLACDPGYQAVQTIPGIGSVLAAVLVAEIGDVYRFPNPARLCSWAGLTPRHRESDNVVHRGRITKQGSRLVRWATVEAVQHLRVDSKLRGDFVRIAERRGYNIARVAAARRLLTLVFYALRDGHVRCLARASAA